MHRDDWESSSTFDDKEKSVIRFSSKLTRVPPIVTDVYVKRLRKWFGEAHLVELNLIVGTMNLTHRFNLCFGVELETTETSRR